jgi:hypothetical protein
MRSRVPKEAGQLLGQLSDCEMLTKDSAPWNQKDWIPEKWRGMANVSQTTRTDVVSCQNVSQAELPSARYEISLSQLGGAFRG